MKVHVFAPNIVIGITFIDLRRGKKLVRLNYFSSIYFCRTNNANFADFFAFDRTTLLTTDNTPLVNIHQNPSIQSLSLQVVCSDKKHAVKIQYLSVQSAHLYQVHTRVTPSTPVEGRPRSYHTAFMIYVQVFPKFVSWKSVTRNHSYLAYKCTGRSVFIVLFLTPGSMPRMELQVKI